MKNIHILPPKNSSRLFVWMSTLMLLDKEISDEGVNHHVYITNNEKVKDNDYVIYDDKPYRTTIPERMRNPRLLIFIPERHSHIVYSNEKKIILTDDKDLIKNGVQSVNDEFLEWLVNNPICETVNTVYEPKNYFDTSMGWEYTILNTEKMKTKSVFAENLGEIYKDLWAIDIKMEDSFSTSMNKFYDVMRKWGI